jgi:hypothetical protein
MKLLGEWRRLFAGPTVIARAGADERTVLPGDELLTDVRAQVTHRVDIAAPAAEVWPWLVQMGRRRAGWYSWDLLDNGGVASADRIIPALQKLAVGDRIPLDASGSEVVAVLRLEPPRALVLGDPALLPGSSTASTSPVRATWSFALEPLGERSTRLHVRVRVAYPPSVKAALARPVLTAMHEVMQRKQLRTLKQRAESAPRVAGRNFADLR